MSDKDFALIVGRALIMILRALNKKYDLRFWILDNNEKSAITKEFKECQDGVIEISKIERYFRDM